MRFLGTLAIVLGTTGMFAQTEFDEAKKVEWTVQNKTKLTELFQDRSAVSAFVHQLYGDVAVGPNVGEYALVDLGHDGTIQLVVTLDFSSRAFYTTILIVSKAHNQFRTNELSTSGANLTDLASHIVDLHRDGTKQLVVPRQLGVYGGASPAPVVPDVYKWDGQKPEKANSEYKDYYRSKVLPKLNKALAELNQKQSTTSTANKAGPEDKRAQGAEEENMKLREKYLVEINEVNKILND